LGRIQGDLDVLGIANVLQALTASHRSGRLSVSRDGERRLMYFGSKGIRLLGGTQRVTPLGEVLVRTRRINRTQLAEILKDPGKRGLSLGEYLIKKEILTQEAIDKALKEQVADEMYDLFTWTGGTFEFVEGEDDAAPQAEDVLSTVVLDQSVMFIALEAARRMDHLARIREVIPDERLVPVLLEVPMWKDDPGIDRYTLTEALSYVDGERSVAEIIEESLYPRFTVLFTLYAVAQRGAAKIIDMGAPKGPETVQFRPPPVIDTPSGPQPASMLLLSDDLNFRVTLALHLRTQNFRVADGPLATNISAVLNQARPDLLLLDLDLNAPKVVERCAALRRDLKLPFIVLTSLAGGETITNAFRSGATHVILKPVNLELLVERICGVFEKA
jgi:CheY-like chemotaxis protein